MQVLNTRMTVRHALLASALLAVAAGPVMADLLPKIEKKLENGSVLRFYGQINKGFLWYDDGQEAELYSLIDNQNSNTRFGVTFNADIADGWKYLGTIEIQYAPFTTNTASINQQSPPSSAYDLNSSNIRKIDNQFTSDRFGTFHIGQGNMASQDGAEVDLSGTTVVAKSSVQDTAGGQLLRYSDGTLSNISIKSAFNNYNGLGRRVRIRYDTPDFNGFSLRTSFGRDLLYRTRNQEVQEAVRDQNLYDVALAYAGASGDFKYAAQVSYGYKQEYSVNGTETPATELWVGSGSVLHTPTGLSLTVAAGQQDNGKYTGDYAYIKAGWQSDDVVAWGKTAVAIDYYDGNNIDGKDSESQQTSISVMQTVTDWNTEFYATYAVYSYDQEARNFDDGEAILIGAGFKF